MSDKTEPVVDEFHGQGGSFIVGADGKRVKDPAWLAAIEADQTKAEAEKKAADKPKTDAKK